MQEDTCSACLPVEQEVQRNMPAEEDIAALAEFFRVIGSDTRLKILLALDGRELCAGLWPRPSAWRPARCPISSRRCGRRA